MVGCGHTSLEPGSLGSLKPGDGSHAESQLPLDPPPLLFLPLRIAKTTPQRQEASNYSNMHKHMTTLPP